MTRRLSPRMVWLTEQALAVLRGRQGPVSTPEVMRSIGTDPADAQAVWRALNWLERHGLVNRVRLPEARTVHWERADHTSGGELPSDAELEALLNDWEADSGS